MLTWRVGAVTIKRIVELEMPIGYDAKHPFLKEATPEALAAVPWLAPDFVTADGSLRLSIHALLVEAPGLRLVVDTCIGNDRPRKFLAGQPLQTAFLDRLAEAGWSCEAVDDDGGEGEARGGIGWAPSLPAAIWSPLAPSWAIG